METAQNTGLTEIQTFVGTLSSAAGTLMYNIRAAASDGGGHVQAANTGGTAQTTYTLGDLLVATSSSSLGRLAVGTDNQEIRANSSVAGGMQWYAPISTTNRIAVSASLVGMTGSVVTETSMVAASIAGSTLGTRNAVHGRIFVQNFLKGGPGSVLLNANYGGVTFASMEFAGPSTGSSQSVKGIITLDVLGNGSTTLQKGIFMLDVKRPATNTGWIQGGSIGGLYDVQSSVFSVDSAASQILGLTVRYTASDTTHQLYIDGYEIEQIT